MGNSAASPVSTAWTGPEVKSEPLPSAVNVYPVGHAGNDKESGIATAEDVCRDAESLAWGPEEVVIVPVSQRKFIMRRPTRIYFALRRMRWPSEFREKADAIMAGQPGVELSEKDQAFYNSQQDHMVWDAFVAPKPTFKPGPSQFDPRILHDKDREFINAYLRGQVLADGTHLDTFHSGEPGIAKDSGPDRADVRTTSLPGVG